MSKQRIISTKFWSDPFIQELETDAKLLYLYLISNERTSICGIYEITERTICFDTGIPLDRLRQIVSRLVQTGKIKKYKNWIHLTNFSKHQKNNPSIQQGIERALKELPDGLLDRLGTDCPQSGLLELELELKPELELELKESSTKIEPTALKKKRNPDVDKMLIALKGKVGIDSFVDSAIERNMARHCFLLMQKIGPDEFRRRLEILLADNFHAKNMNKIKYVFNNIKGFKEPIKAERIAYI